MKLIRKIFYTFLIILFSQINYAQTRASLIAFPGAEGFGKFTTGGRSGVVYEVTNLNDDNVLGSLRYAVNQKGTRTIVFRISGTITLKSSLSIKNGNLTIAGQTAPGDGICLRGFPLSVDADNVIIRFIRIRLGDESGGESDATGGRYRKNIMIDHCSASWSVDETMSFYWNDSLTVQWCIISESLYNSNHPKGSHGYGGIWGGNLSTYHHNLLAHHSSRNPRFASGSGINDVRNNVIYNWGFNSAYGGEAKDQTQTQQPMSAINLVANYYKPGPATKNNVRNRIVSPDSRNGANDYGRWYISDNLVVGNPDITNNNWNGGVQPILGSSYISVFKVDQPFDIIPIQQQSAEEAYKSVLLKAGVIFPKRDPVDSRIVNEVKNGNATFEGKTYKQNNPIPDPSKICGIIDSQTDVGGWPSLNSLPAPLDSDHDGMPDDWEKAHGLNPNDAGDRNNIASSGYTMLEEYLNGLVSDALTNVEKDKSIPTELKLNQNYPNPFNPETVISYQLASTGHVTLKMYDLLGREVATIVDDYKQPGNYSSQFSISNYELSSGVYFYQLKMDQVALTKKMILLK